MKVLVLGLPRTGTQSIADALVELGISPVYHMREVMKNGHTDLWIAAMKAKFEGEGAPWGRDEFEQILRGFEGVSDYPAAIFPTELIAAYPEAVVVLSTRASEDVWHRSMVTTLIHQQAHRPADDVSPMGELSRLYHRHCWGDGNGEFDANGRAFYRAHNETVRAAAAAAAAAAGRRFLEYDTAAGWGPLCAFLGVPVPETAFPRSDAWIEYKKMVEEEEKAKAKAPQG